MANKLKQYQHLVIYSLIVVCIFFLFIGTGVKQKLNEEIKELWNLGHFFLFLFFAYPAFIKNKLNQHSLIKRLLITTVACGLMATGIEFLQQFFNRDVSLHDIFVSLMGAFCSIFLFTKLPKKIKAIGFITFALIGCSTFIMQVYNYGSSYIAKPYELGISNPGSTTSVLGKAKKKLLANNEGVLITYSTAAYSTLKITNVKNDWSKHSNLLIDIGNKSSEIYSVRIRILDQTHLENGLDWTDRFDKRIRIKPGAQVLKIDLDEVKNFPATRQMDMTNIQEIMIYTYYARDEFNALLRSITLE